MLCQLNNTAHGSPALLRSKENRASKLYIIFPSSQPLGWISVFSGKCKQKGHPGYPLMSLLNYTPGVVSEMQTVPDPCQDVSLAFKSCPLPSTRENKSGLWKLGIATCFSGYVIPGWQQGGLWAKLFPKGYLLQTDGVTLEK